MQTWSSNGRSSGRGAVNGETPKEGSLGTGEPELQYMLDEVGA